MMKLTIAGLLVGSLLIFTVAEPALAQDERNNNGSSGSGGSGGSGDNGYLSENFTRVSGELIRRYFIFLL